MKNTALLVALLFLIASPLNAGKGGPIEKQPTKIGQINKACTQYAAPVFIGAGCLMCCTAPCCAKTTIAIQMMKSGATANSACNLPWCQIQCCGGIIVTALGCVGLDEKK